MARIAVFIDWANVCRGLSVDVVKFRQFLESLGANHVVYAYMVNFDGLKKKDDPAEAKRSPEGFRNVIRKQGFRLRLKDVKVVQREGKDDAHKANWDIGMTIDILKTAQSGKVDEVILFSGDSDFEPLIQEIQSPPYLIKVTVVARGRQTAGELRRCADCFIDLEEHLSKFSRPFEVRPRREIVEEATREDPPESAPQLAPAPADAPTVLTAFADIPPDSDFVV